MAKTSVLSLRLNDQERAWVDGQAAASGVAAAAWAKARLLESAQSVDTRSEYARGPGASRSAASHKPSEPTPKDEAAKRLEDIRATWKLTTAPRVHLAGCNCLMCKDPK